VERRFGSANFLETRRKEIEGMLPVLEKAAS
jgi:hypothetical protein